MSESSLKRWVDAGKLNVSRTAGGHRRISMSEAVRFLRASGYEVRDPEALGLTAGQVLAGRADQQQIVDALVELLQQGDERGFTSALISLYIDGKPLPELFDGPLRGAMAKIGELWNCRSDGIGIEHRAAEICYRAVAELRSTLPHKIGPAPAAVGGGPPDDPYLLPSMCIASVLAEQGWHDANLGANVPWAQFSSMAKRYNAALVWLSVTGDPPDDLEQQIKDLANNLADQHATLLIGGQRVPERVKRIELTNVHFASTLAELAAFARGILSASRKFRPDYLNGAIE